MKKFDFKFNFDSEQYRGPILSALQYLVYELPLIIQIALALAIIFTPAFITLVLLVAVIYDGVFADEKRLTKVGKKGVES